MNTSVPAATVDEQKYLDLAANYVGRAMTCYKQELWPEAATNFGSALESLLRIRYGSKDKLFKLVEKYDHDPLFDNITLHTAEGKVCSTCVADHTRVMRNSVHPDCWKEATKKDVDAAASIVMLIYHTLVVCSSKIANFQASPDTTLSEMEAEGVFAESNHSHS
jgi:hypothetical protein